MWALVITGIFTMVYRGTSMEIDSTTLQMMMEMSGDITIAQIGYKTEADCRAQLQTIEGKHQVVVNGIKITMKTAQCRNEETKDSVGRGPNS